VDPSECQALPRYDLNISILLTHLPMLERPVAAAAMGYDAVEMWWPFDEPVPPDSQLDALAKAIDEAGVSLVGLNFDAGNMAEGERGLLSRPSQARRFRDNLDVTLGFAQRMGCRVLNALYGNREPDLNPRRQDELAVENLALATKAAEGIGATVVVEALNSYESPHYPITSSAMALRVIDQVPAANIAFLADFYHLYRMGEDLAALITSSAHRFGHVQIADVPGRGAPGTGEIPFDTLLPLLAASPYQGRIGLEYKEPA
jgi:hydroxypyruvate isomerase